MPPHARRGENRGTEPPGVDQRLQACDVGLHPILEDDGERDAGSGGFGDQPIGARGGRIDRFFGEDVQAVLRRRDALLRVQSGRTADDHQVHRSVIEEAAEVVVGRSAGARREPLRPIAPPSADGDDARAVDLCGRVGMGLTDVARADEADVDHRAAKSVNSRSRRSAGAFPSSTTMR